MVLKAQPHIIFLLMLFAAQFCVAQYAPYFQNYDVSHYNAGNQNWGVAKADDGRLYVANNKGLLEFDGLKWTLNALPNKTTIRSVLAVEGKVYSGSYEEFGFWERDNYGQLNYTSLSNALDAKEFLSEEFWQIIKWDDAIIFRSFLNFYIFKDGEIEKISPPSTVISCNVIDGTLYIATLKDGILSFENGILKSFIKSDVLVDSKIVSISKRKDEFLITTALEGIFTYVKGVLKPWNAEITAIVKEHQLNVFTQMNNGDLVFGTIQNGVYITNSKGEVHYHIHKENGLINNTVLSQYIDGNDQLWMGLDNGLASADLKSPYLFYNDVTGKLGGVYDVINYQNTVYIGSNTGLFYLDQNNALQFIDGSQGQVWDLKEIEGDLFCGHNNGTYIVKDKKLILISEYTGGWVIKKVVDVPKTYIQGTYAGLVKFKKENDKWTVKHLGKTTIPSRFLVFEDAYTVWVAHAYKGLYKITFDTSYDSILDIKNYEHKGLWSTYNARVYKLKNDIAIKTNKGWQKYEPLLDTIVPYELLNKSFGKDSYIISESEINILVVKNQNSISFKTFPDDGLQASLSDKYFKKRLVVGYENVSQLHDTTQALSLENGFMLFDKTFSANSNTLYEPYIQSIIIDQKPLALNNFTTIEVANDFKMVTISMTSPKSRDHFFEYITVSADVSPWYKIENEKLELSNMSYGTYELSFRTSNNLGETSSSYKMIINVLPPWYRSTQGYVFFGFLLGLLMVFFYLMHRRKIQKQHKVLQMKFAKEQNDLIKEKTVENERHIVALKNESLKSEVKLKSKQLANTAMALVKKNETLLELKKEILVNKNGFENYNSYKNIIKKIDTSIGHKDEWKVFEYNFNQVHEEFFSQLKHSHPKLTSKDLRVCAYIKMNLSTKEIAPLLNISARGVETQRYRLKNKLKLDSDQSLTDYLLHFK